MIARLLFLLAAAAVAAGVFFFGPRPAATLRTSPEAIAQDVESKLRELAAGVHSRATTLADLPRLQAAVATDKATVRDLTQDELAFRPKKGERITIGQVPKRGAPQVLLTLPEGAAAYAPLDQFGAHFGTDGQILFVVENVAITPTARAEELLGAMAILWAIDRPTLGASIDGFGVSAQLLLDGKSFGLGTRAAAPGDGQKRLRLALSGKVPVELVVMGPVNAPPLGPWQWGALGLLVASALGALGWPREQTTSLVAPNALRSSIEFVAEANAPRSSPQESQFGRYDLVRKLGSGGMAEVYLARARGEAGFEKFVALKVLHKAMAAEPMIVEHFLDEARLASRLSHPNIVQITDLGKAGDEYFIAMEYVDGPDLERLLLLCRARGEQVPLRVALFALRKICDGLHAAHLALGADGVPLGLVHRDVKSSNVFVSREGAVKVGDFGIAKVHAEGAARRTAAGIVKGTAAYMAPEQRSGQTIDCRADLYAVGAIAYELLTGQQINLDLAVLAARGRDGWPHLALPSSVRHELPADLDAILWKALAYEPADRYSSCSELEEAFDAVATATGQVASEKALAQWVDELLKQSAETQASV